MLRRMAEMQEQMLQMQRQIERMANLNNVLPKPAVEIQP